MTAARRLDVGALELGAGLETLVSASLVGMEAGEEIDVLSDSRLAAGELASWARRAGHEIVAEPSEQGRGGRCIVRLRRAPFALADDAVEGEPPVVADGRFSTAELRRTVGPVPSQADPRRGMVPLGSIAASPLSGRTWRRSERDPIWADDLGRLLDRSARSQWDATTDIPWAAAQDLAPDVERAVAQVMTYVAQNEYAAYYVPARYLSEVNPEYLELLMWLSSHVHDEARHIEVFTKRALLGGIRSPSLDSTDLSLQTLLDEHDFTSSALLLNVLGEGTFSDLLGFIARHAPDAATATAAGLARRDEQRHVSFGIAHVRRRLEADPEQRQVLTASVEARAAKLTTLTGLSPAVRESLTLMSARSRSLADVAEAGLAVRRLFERMHENRVRRLRAAGFDRASARHLSELHTVNLM